jgi:hypothetical protein
MRKTANRQRNRPKSAAQLAALRNERKKLTARLEMVDSKISQMSASHAPRKPQTAAEIDRWLEELADGFPTAPPLPSDFSRADLYDDHD